MSEPTEAQLDEERAYILAAIKTRGPRPDGVKAAHLVNEILADAGPGETFSPTRYPFTYAYDFVRQHASHFTTWMTPDEQRRMSRTDAGYIVDRYCEDTEQTKDGVVLELALGYLHENRVPVSRAKREAVWVPEGTQAERTQRAHETFRDVLGFDVPVGD